MGDTQSEVLAGLGVPYVASSAPLPEGVPVGQLSADARFQPLLLALGLAAEDLVKTEWMLSRGTRQKVALAQGFLSNLFVADEPLSGLDGPSRLRCHDVLAAHLAGGGSAVLAAWDVGELAALVTRRVEVA